MSSIHEKAIIIYYREINLDVLQSVKIIRNTTQTSRRFIDRAMADKCDILKHYISQIELI